MKFSYILEQSPRDWEITMHQNLVLTIFHTKIYVTMRGKLSEPHFDVLLFSNPGDKVQKARKTMGQICTTVLIIFMTFSPRLETNDTLQFSSESFPRMVTYIFVWKIVRTTFRRIVVSQSRGDCSRM